MNDKTFPPNSEPKPAVVIVGCDPERALKSRAFSYAKKTQRGIEGKRDRPIPVQEDLAYAFMAGARWADSTREHRR